LLNHQSKDSSAGLDQSVTSLDPQSPCEFVIAPPRKRGEIAGAFFAGNSISRTETAETKRESFSGSATTCAIRQQNSPCIFEKFPQGFCKRINGWLSVYDFTAGYTP
jgi:hypothetical protein